MRLITAFLLLILFHSCSRAPLKETSTPDVSPLVERRIEEARGMLAKGQSKLAIAKLGELQDEELQPLEKALKYNLKGVALFTESEWEKALANFEVAKKYVPYESVLASQVWLNIASVRYKQELYVELKDALDSITPDVLSDAEVGKYAQLKLAWALKYKKHEEIVDTSILLLKKAQTLQEVQDSVLKDRLLASFKELEDREKLRLLDRYQDKNWAVLAYIGQQEAEARYFKGDTDGTEGILSWLAERFSHDAQVMSYVKDFEHRLDVAQKLSMNGIGVVLPLSGEKGSFGQKVLLGLDAAFKGANLGREIDIHTRDSLDSPAVGAQAVRDIIQKHQVPLIVGGLFPEAAKAEYLEAKKWGVLYVSLAPIHLLREEKNHLLIEVQGSIESQVATLVSDEILNTFGKRLGVIYPQGEAGKAYAEEFWRASALKNLKLTAVASYPKGTLDFRETVQHFLGLKFTRERQEELEIYTQTYAHEKSTIRRIQSLPPALDFDWVFVASFPHEALSLLPTFGYYDARNVKIIGGPSWGSRVLLKEQKNIGKLYFVGEDPGDLNQEFYKKFHQLHNRAPTLLDILGYDGGLMASQLLRDGSISTRTNFSKMLRDLGHLKGMTTDWSLTDGLWIKRMQPLAIRNGEIQKVFE